MFDFGCNFIMSSMFISSCGGAKVSSLDMDATDQDDEHSNPEAISINFTSLPASTRDGFPLNILQIINFHSFDLTSFLLWRLNRDA